MKIGIDFGTTRTAVALADRGNYPLVSFQSDTGGAEPWYPGLIAARGDSLAFGLAAAERLTEPGWAVLRSLKRHLGFTATPVRVGGIERPVLDLMAGYFSELRQDLHRHSNAGIAPSETLEAWISVPANAGSNQRFLTVEAFRRSGFRVLGVLNEPSAAGIEYAHRYGGGGSRGALVVYDLGGGTFDTSVLELKDGLYEVLADEGIANLGGDDFDALLLELALARQGTSAGEATAQLLEECRRQKEALHPNTRRIVVDLGEPVTVTTDQFYARCSPRIEETIAAVERAVARAEQLGSGWKDISAIYVVGGASDLPAVTRMLRERYGRRVRRSPYCSGATAIGLAIAAAMAAGSPLRERFTRFFGVWRESEGGRSVTFDPIFPKGIPLPRAGEAPLVRSRQYHPAHNVAHMRYLECGRLDEMGAPAGDLIPWDEIFFPVDPGLAEQPSLAPVRRTSEFEAEVIEELYHCASDGVIEVTISNQTTGLQRRYRLRQDNR